MDAGGTPQISYYDNTNGDLKYANRMGVTWTVETVDAAGNVGRYTSLAVDAWGTVSISYFDVTNRDLKYANIDFTPPAVSSPLDITYEERMTGYFICWTIGDTNPDTYAIYNNSMLEDSGSWINGIFAWNINGLAMDSYNFTLTVNDTSNYYALNTVWVTVTPPPAPVTRTVTRTVWDTVTETITETTTKNVTEIVIETVTEPLTTVSDTVTTTVTIHEAAALPELELSALGLTAVLGIVALTAREMRRKRR